MSDALKEEIDICGTDCFHKPDTCQCPVNMNSTKFDEINKRFSDYLKLEMDSEDNVLADNPGNSKHLNMTGARDSNIELMDESVYGKLMTFEDDHVDKFIHQMKILKSVNHNKNKLLFLPNLSKIQTSWGIVKIDSLTSPISNFRNIDTTWATSRKEKGKVIVKGTVIGKLKLSDYTGMSWTITSEEASEQKTISMYIVEAAQTYNLKLKYYTASRKLSKWYRGTCTGNCPKECACSSSTCKYKKWDYDRGWGCNPTWCWSISSGCSCCAADVVSGPRKWIVGVFQVEYKETQIVFCLNEGHDQVSCHVTNDNEKLSINNYKITISKAYAQDNKLPKTIALVWFNDIDNKDFIQIKHPTYIWDDPRICDEGCNHGDIGDYKAYDLITASGIDSFKTLQMAERNDAINSANLLTATRHQIYHKGSKKEKGTRQDKPQDEANTKSSEKSTQAEDRTVILKIGDREITQGTML